VNSKQIKSKPFKYVSAAIGAAGVIAMGAFGAAFTAASEGTQSVSDGPEITLGETTTSTTGQTEIATPVASPEVTAEPAPTA
jgi:hypothetical protein